MDEPKYAFFMRRLHRLQLLHTIACRRSTTDIDLHMRQLPILEFIIGHDCCTQIEIADAMRVSAQSVALSTKRMGATGLIEKHTDPDNLRCKRLSVTEKGKAVSAQCRERFDEIDKQMCAGLTQSEIQTLCDLLDRLSENLCDETLFGLSLRDLRAMVCCGEQPDDKNEDNKEE